MNDIMLYRIFLEKYKGKTFTIDTSSDGKPKALCEVKGTGYSPCRGKCKISDSAGNTKKCPEPFFIDGWCSWRFNKK